MFKEEDTWDGIIYKLVEEDVVTPHAEDEQGIHGGQLTPHTPTPLVRTPVRTLRIHEHGEPSSVGG